MPVAVDDQSFEADDDAQLLPPTDTGRGAYVALACCTVSQAPIWGYSVSFGIFQEYYSNDSDIYGSPGAFASIGAAQVGVMYLLMPVIFVLLHRRPRWRPWCGRLGLVITMASISASAFVSTVHGLIATQGVVYALGCALLFSPVSVYMDEWFVRSKGAAYGVMWGGKSAVGVGMPFVFNAMLSRFGLSITLLSWAVASALLSLPALLLMKPRLPLPASGDARGSRPLSWRFFRCTTFWMMQLGVVIQSLGYMMPSTYLASYALAIGLPSVTGPLLLAAFSLASVPGSIIHGFVGDKVSASKAILVSSFGSALPVFLLWGLSLHFANVMAFALAFGFFAGRTPLHEANDSKNPTTQMRPFQAFTSALVASTAAVAADTMLGFDASSVHGAVDFGQAYADGARFAIMRTTGGSSHVDRAFGQFQQQAADAGLIRGGYHVGQPERAFGGIQAKYFLQNGGGWIDDGKTLPGMIMLTDRDHREARTCHGMTPKEIQRWIIEFTEVYRASTSIYPMLYTTTGWWKQCTGNTVNLMNRALLVVSDHGERLGELPAGWKKHTFWEYSADSPWAGRSYVFNGDESGLNRTALVGRPE
ncbi:MFS monocarboxylate transporter [Ophiocordyceps camponoti-floridani]|uniref:MFS monocarboxylate transporter n=1 Tax=Ophiocordyceps camponoti-floridani TaxID=2030778 RepID=A0A8H4QAN0_9HYPO|nr:MFS monocarboxylate transporter [Ophiocordyceps camponoti-floridani]